MADDWFAPRDCWCTLEERAAGRHRHRCPAAPLPWIKRVPWGIDGSTLDNDDSDDRQTRRDEL